jgi:hypothetical protein
MILDVDGDSNGIFNEPSDFILFEATGDNEVLVRATVYDIYGLPEPFSVVTFGSDFPFRIGSDTFCSDGTNECEVVFPLGNTATTDINGQASVIVRVDPITIRTISALMNITATADNGAANLVTLFLEPVLISNVVVSADPDIVNTDGNSTITIGVTLNTGHPAPDGTSVNLTTCDAATCTSPCGSIDPFVQITDGGTNATFNAPSIPNICRVNATANGFSGFTDIVVTDDLAVSPDSIDVNGTVGGTATFTVLNGIAPYTVIADTVDLNLQPIPDPADMTPLADSGDFFQVIVPAGTADTTVTYAVRDSQGDTVEATLTVTADALTVLPSSMSINGTVGGIATFTVYGGIPGYTIITNDPLLPSDKATIANSEGTFTVTVPAGTASTTVTYTLRDSAGYTVNATLDITADALTVLPGSVDVDGLAGGTVDFYVYGGVPGYDIFVNSVDPNLQPNTTTITNSGDFFKVTVPAATVCPTSAEYNIRDQSGSTVTATLSITLLPITVVPTSAIICEIGGGCGGGLPDSVTFTIFGGTGIYNTISDNPSVIPDPGAANPFTVNPNDVAADTPVTLTTVDSCGISVATTVDVINN